MLIIRKMTDLSIWFCGCYIAELQTVVNTLILSFRTLFDTYTQVTQNLGIQVQQIKEGVPRSLLMLMTEILWLQELLSFLLTMKMEERSQKFKFVWMHQSDFTLNSKANRPFNVVAGSFETGKVPSILVMRKSHN
jgi:hypothetical protein